MELIDNAYALLISPIQKKILEPDGKQKIFPNSVEKSKLGQAKMYTALLV